MEYKIEYVNIDKLIPNEINTRQHTDKDINNLIKSIQRFGFRNPIICNKQGVILCGNGRYEAIKRMGIKEVPVHYADLDEKEAKAFAIMDNRSAELSNWNLNTLIPQLEVLDLDGLLEYTGFNDYDLKSLSKDLSLLQDTNLETDEDEYEETEIFNKYNVELGDIYYLGKHKIACMDATDLDSLKTLIGGGEINMVFTDPPYNVNFYSISDGDSYINKGILNDNIEALEFENLIDKSFNNFKELLKPKGHLYICCNYRCYSIFEKYFLKYFKNLNNCIVWNKSVPGLGWAYRPKHEFIIFGTDDKSVKFSDRTQTNVWDFHSASSFKFRQEDLGGNQRAIHPTMKPIKLIEKALINSSKQGDIILDLFLGSGSTLIASDNLNRICYGTELDPHYVSVIIDRYIQLKGDKEVYKLNIDNTKTHIKEGITNGTIKKDIRK